MLVNGSKSDSARGWSKIQLFKNIGRVRRRTQREIINRKRYFPRGIIVCFAYKCRTGVPKPLNCSGLIIQPGVSSALLENNVSPRSNAREGKKLCSFLHSDYAVPRGTPCIPYTGEQARERTAQCASRLGVIADGPYLVMFTTQIAIKHAYRSVPCPRRTLADLSICPRRFFLVARSSPGSELFSIHR